jgi:multidrug resistance protein, MATE family
LDLVIASCCRVRVANELGAGNGEGARFATIVSTVTSLVIGLFFWVLIMGLHDKYALIFTSSPVVLDAVDHLSVLLAFTILLNSIQPILSGQHRSFCYLKKVAPNHEFHSMGRIT